MIEAGSKKLYFSFSWISSGGGAPLPASILADQRRERDPCEVTILFVPVSIPVQRLAADWAEDSDEIIIRRCPVCGQDSIIGHGRRRKQAHDEYHDWIGIRRGRCVRCGRTFTFLPVFSLPYTHYSLLTRCQALLRRMAEPCSWEKAVPRCKDPDRQPDPSTVRRWSSGLDRCRSWHSFFDQFLARVTDWLRARGEDEVESVCRLLPVLQVFCPMRR